MQFSIKTETPKHTRAPAVPQHESSSRSVLTAQVLDGAVHNDVGRENSDGDAKARKGTLVAPRYHRVLSPCILPGKHHPILFSSRCLEISPLHSVAAPGDAVLARKAPLSRAACFEGAA